MSEYTYACGCVKNTDDSWTLCAECDARIGKHGTCLVCGGPANELWTVKGFEDQVQGCSPQCAEADALAALEGVA